MLGFLDDLKANDVFRSEDLAGIRSREAVPPAYADSFPSGLDPSLIRACKENGITRLFEHQAAAIREVQGGRDIVLVSPTASGKTLCFNLPIISELYKTRDSHALYVYPMKALAHDQLLAVKELTRWLTPQHAVSSWPFDGDTETDARKLLKTEPPNIIITNPDSLHYAMLAYHEQWLKFLHSLRYLVLDEAHEYRGYFGINVAYVVRRLLALCASLGARPQIIVSSATIANPEEHAYALTGRNVQVAATEKAGSCKKHFVFLNPDYRDFQYENVLMRKLSLLAATCVEKDVSALIFCPTRRFVERLHRRTTNVLNEKGLREKSVAPYKAGYTADERRDIEKGLKDGSITVVFSTNALEIGIDMGRLDVVVMVGFPDTVMSAWQRAGRAGRSLDKEALVIFWASRNPIDQFYVHNIDMFMNKPLDRLAVNLDNEEVLEGHALCALFEHGGSRDYLTSQTLGSALADRCSSMSPDLSLMKKVRPHRRVNLRSIFGQTYVIKSRDSKEIGTISGDKLFSEVYIGAIYDHYGRSWRVSSHGADEVFVEPNDLFHYTKPTRRWSIELTERLARGRRWRSDVLGVTLLWGQVQVKDILYGYKEFDEKSGELVDDITYQAASFNTFRTDGCWLQLDHYAETPPETQFLMLHSLEHGLRATIPLAIPCDPYDLAGLTMRSGPQALPTLYLYDSVKGGIGISEEVAKGFIDMVRGTRAVFEECRCEASCPRCIQLSRCTEYNEMLDRAAGRTLADTIKDLLQSTPSRLDIRTLEWRD